MNSQCVRSRGRAALRRVVMALLLGAILQTVVAWGAATQEAALWQRIANQDSVRILDVVDSEIWGWGVQIRGRGITAYRFHPSNGLSPINAQPFGVSDPDNRPRTIRLSINTLPTPVRPPDQDMAQSWRVTMTGWPFRSMSAADLWVWRDTSQTTARQVQMGMRREGLVFGEFAPRWLIGPTSPARLSTLPLNPVWTGFLGNSVFYGAVLLAIFAVVSEVRRLVRIRRGRCSACGYDMQGAAGGACPECGAQTSNAPVTDAA